MLLAETAEKVAYNFGSKAREKKKTFPDLQLTDTVKT